jgi:hypothetical protein
MPKVYTTCVENSIICARAWYTQTGNPVRIAVTKVDPVNDIDHAQAQARMNGIWTPLTEIWHPQEGKMEVVPWKPHFEIEPYVEGVDRRTDTVCSSANTVVKDGRYDRR